MRRFSAGVDPVDYDLRTTVELFARYGDPILVALRQLRTVDFLFPRMSRLHQDALDPELLFRQTLPAAAVGARMGADPEALAEYLKIYALGQTLILNNMDRHLDLSASYSIRDPALLLADVNSTMCFAVTSLLAMVREASLTPAGVRALPFMAGVTAEIVQSMHDNYAGRFDAALLDGGEGLLSWYRTDVRSRHLGSGFYSSVLLGLLAYIEEPVPDGLADILRDMRRLRQRVDELADLFEDTVTGLVSYPVAKGLAEPELKVDLRRLIRKLWTRSQQVIDSRGRDAGVLNRALAGDPELVQTHGAVLEMLVSSGIMRECYRETDALWHELALNLQALDPRFGEPLTTIIDLKRALLDRLAMNGWHDHPPPHTFQDMIEAAGLEGTT
ncbi:hypothetical protein C1I95_18310 [Micromonospora craterilacus]|uniref:Uncharacterized protein n=1 Tax=Micromonospora craterilacus TaxID=1655439 RepID=A0A2W2DW93_9ACTN|nr:hypothetical protein [Micromonospora craterilacus]PZG16112.1 hypothetical protein C1I95_18310 [Micromonospora craterilacus]